MNKFIGIGRTTSKPELMYTNSGKAYTRFTVAINRLKKEDGTQEANFINCVAWNKLAETICTYVEKGYRLAVEGNVQTGSYENSAETKIYTTDINVINIEFLESKKESRPEPTPYGERDPFESDEETVSTDDDFLE